MMKAIRKKISTYDIMISQALLRRDRDFSDTRPNWGEPWLQLLHTAIVYQKKSG